MVKLKTANKDQAENLLAEVYCSFGSRADNQLMDGEWGQFVILFGKGLPFAIMIEFDGYRGRLLEVPGLFL
jgi:hypothetical protein